MKKFFMLCAVCCMCLCLFGCSNDNTKEPIKDPSTNDQNIKDDDSNESSLKRINIDDYPDLKEYSTSIINQINAQSKYPLKYNYSTFKPADNLNDSKDTYAVLFHTDEGNTDFALGFNENHEFNGISILGKEDYLEEFMEIQFKYLSLCDFYPECLGINECSETIMGTSKLPKEYTINNIEIYHSGLLGPLNFMTFSITDTTK